MNLFETKGSREVWLDRFAASNMPIDTFCKMNHIKKETITKVLNEKMLSYREKHPPKQPAVNPVSVGELQLQKNIKSGGRIMKFNLTNKEFF